MGSHRYCFFLIFDQQPVNNSHSRRRVISSFSGAKRSSSYHRFSLRPPYKSPSPPPRSSTESWSPPSALRLERVSPGFNFLPHGLDRNANTHLPLKRPAAMKPFSSLLTGNFCSVNSSVLSIWSPFRGGPSFSFKAAFSRAPRLSRAFFFFFPFLAFPSYHTRRLHLPTTLPASPPI